MKIIIKKCWKTVGISEPVCLNNKVTNDHEDSEGNQELKYQMCMFVQKERMDD